MRVARIARPAHPAPAARARPRARTGARQAAPVVLRRQPLAVADVDSPLEREAEMVADRIIAMPMGTGEPQVQRMCPECDEELRRQPTEEDEEEELLQTKAEAGGPMAAGAEAAAAAVAHGGRPLSRTERSFFEPRFGRDLSAVRIHDGPRAGRAAGGISARAYTLGRDIAFAPGQYQPDNETGRHLIAHELTHAIQQRATEPPILQRQETRRRRPRPNRDPTPALDFRPATNTPPCACLVFVHNDERNARRAIQALHRTCRYNLAIVGGEGARDRNIRVRGETGPTDPNELFPSDVRTTCEADIEACRTYAAENDDLRATQMAYYLAIRECTSAFSLPLVALHNNVVWDTARVRNLPIDPATGSGLARRFAAAPTGDQLSTDELRDRLTALGVSRPDAVRVLSRPRTTNIYRWCNLPEIGRCVIGDPANPDHVIWVVRDADFERFGAGEFNVVQQTRASEGGESDTDLSTLLLGIEDARFINIETPHTVKGELDPESQRLENMQTILLALRAAGLECCDVEPSPGTTTGD